LQFYFFFSLIIYLTLSKKVITYASNNNTVIQPKRNMKRISQNIYMDKNYHIYVFYQEYNIGLSVTNANEDATVEQVVRYIEKNQFATAEQFLQRIDILIQKELFIKNSEISVKSTAQRAGKG